MGWKLLKGSEARFQELLDELPKDALMSSFAMSTDASKFALIVWIEEKVEAPPEPPKPSAKEIALQKAEEAKAKKKAELEAELAKLEV